MTVEKLKKGQELLERINGLIKQKENWEGSNMFGDVYVLAKINDLINKLQKEFDEL